MKTLDDLKNILCLGKTPLAMLNYFFDLYDNHTISQLNGHQALEDLAHNGAYCLLLSAIRQGIQRYQQLPIQIQEGYFFVAPAYHFIHGAFVVKGLAIPVFYFHDIELGVYAVARGNTLDTFRFSLVKDGGLGLC